MWSTVSLPSPQRHHLQLVRRDSQNLAQDALHAHYDLSGFAKISADHHTDIFELLLTASLAALLRKYETTAGDIMSPANPITRAVDLLSEPYSTRSVAADCWRMSRLSSKDRTLVHRTSRTGMSRDLTQSLKAHRRELAGFIGHFKGGSLQGLQASTTVTATFG